MSRVERNGQRDDWGVEVGSFQPLAINKPVRRSASHGWDSKPLLQQQLHRPRSRLTAESVGLSEWQESKPLVALVLGSYDRGIMIFAGLLMDRL